MHFIASLLVFVMLGISSSYAGSIERASGGDLHRSAICADDVNRTVDSVGDKPVYWASSTIMLAETTASVGSQEISQKCCKVCRKGKACGNSCIARHLTCHQPPGCACDG